MVKRVTVFEDVRGNCHSSAEEATICDIAAILGQVGEEVGFTNGVARLIFERRREIERAFTEFDKMATPAAIIDYPETRSHQG